MAVLFWAALCGLSAAAEETVQGRVQIHTINSDDVITSVYIENDTDRYVVADTPEGRRLFKLIGDDVVVRGNIAGAGDGGQTLEVMSFEIVDDTETDTQSGDTQ